jgi:ribose transport system substrate-binding protein
MKRKAFVFLSLLLVFAVASTFAGGKKDSGTKKVANVLAEYNEWNHIMEDEVKKMANQWGWGYQVFDSGQSVSEQINMVNSAVAQGFDYILIQPCDNAALKPVLEKAADAGVQVINYYNYPDNDPITRKIYQVKFNQKGAGLMQAEEYVKAAGTSGKVALINGLTGADNSRLREEGYKEVLSKHPGIQVVASIFCDWDRQKAMAAAEDIIQAHPDLKAFLVQDDSMSWGVYEAIRAAGKEGQIKISSQGFYESSIPAIKNDIFMYTISYPPGYFGKAALELFKDIADGKSPARSREVGFLLVTKANVDTAPF